MNQKVSEYNTTYQAILYHLLYAEFFRLSLEDKTERNSNGNDLVQNTVKAQWNLLCRYEKIIWPCTPWGHENTQCQ